MYTKTLLLLGYADSSSTPSRCLCVLPTDPQAVRNVITMETATETVKKKEDMSRPNNFANWLAYSRDPRFKCHLL